MTTNSAGGGFVGRERPSPASVALAAERVGASACRPPRRAALTPTGLAVVDVVERFAERRLDLHWDVIADALAGQDPELLRAFVDVQVEGKQLAFDRGQLPRSGRRGEVL